MLAVANLQLFCLILFTDLYLVVKHNLHIKFVLCTSAAVKKLIIGRYWSFGFCFSLRLLGAIRFRDVEFCKFFVIPKILRSFLRFQGSSFRNCTQK